MVPLRALLAVLLVALPALTAAQTRTLDWTGWNLTGERGVLGAQEWEAHPQGQAAQSSRFCMQHAPLSGARAQAHVVRDCCAPAKRAPCACSCPTPTGICAVQIQPDQNRPFLSQFPLCITGVQLIDSKGAQIPSALIKSRMTSAYGGGDTTACNPGSITPRGWPDACLTTVGWVDPVDPHLGFTVVASRSDLSPAIALSYPCALGLSSVRVVDYNLEDQP